MWRHLHEEIIRNHQCKGPAELPDKVFARIGQENPYEIEGSVYPDAMARWPSDRVSRLQAFI